MGIINRFFLLLYVIVVLLTVIIFAGICLQLIPKNIWQFYLDYIMIQNETVVALSVMIFFSLYFIGYVFSSKNKVVSVAEEFSLKAGETGEVKVTISAVKRIIELATLSVSGVREVEVAVIKSQGEIPFSIKLKTVLSQGTSAPDISVAVVEAVHKEIFTALQISNVPIEMKVIEFTNAVVERKQRVV